MKEAWTKEELAKARIGEIPKFDSPPKAIKGNIILFSYNRPNMLREALKSVFNQTYGNFDCYLMDDGSDFDVWDVANEIADERLLVVKIPPCTPAERVSQENTRFPDTANMILDDIPNGQFVVYLCDDDYLHPQWMERVWLAYAKWPRMHIIQGKTMYFMNGEDPLKDGKEGFLSKFKLKEGGVAMGWDDGVFWWNCGSFGIRSECYRACGVFWEKSEGDPHSWDIKYLNKLAFNHVNIIGVPVPAVYRREHENNVSQKLGRLQDDGYGLPTKPLSEDMVSGIME